MMCEIIEKLPLELKLKVLSYKQSPPHFFSMKNGLFPIKNYMLNIIEEPTISLHESETEDDLEDEWLMFQMEMEEPIQSNPHLVSLPQPYHYSPYSDYFL